MKLGNQFCTFYLENLLFGVEVLEVQEVFRYQEMTEVPLAPPLVEGLINLRGQIITAIDLRRRLQLGERPGQRLPMNVVVKTEDGPLSLLVDEIGDVREVSPEAFEPPPDTLSEGIKDLVSGVFKLENQLLLILDISRVVETENAV